MTQSRPPLPRTAAQRLVRARRHLDEGHPALAVSEIRTAVAEYPEDPEAWHLLGIALYADGDGEAALTALSRGESLAPRQPEMALNHARILRERGQPQAALARLEAALACHPGDPRLVLARARTLCRLNLGDMARAALEQLVRERPRDEEIWLLLAECREQGADYAGALMALQQALNLVTDAPGTRRRLARVRIRQGDIAGGERELRQALREAHGTPSEEAQIRLGLADLAALRGDRLAAAGEADASLRLDPSVYAAWLHLVPDRHTAPEPKLAERLAAECRTRAADPYAWPLFLAAGRSLEASARYDDAFRAYTACNLRRGRLVPYDPEARRAYTADLIAALDGEFARRSVYEPTPVQPIFVVGLPRSGTTLVESMLASHPDVAAGGEMGFLHDWLRRRFGAEALQKTGSLVRSLSAQDLVELAVLWRQELERAGGARSWITDKLPDNFALAGLCHVCFPHSPIVLVTRHPADVSISCYTTPFMSGQAHSARLEWLAHYYRLYRRLMEHWQTVLPPDRIIELRYEDLVAEPEQVGRGLFDRIGIPWSPACLEFHRQDRPIATASLYQVREPLNRRSLERWRRFERHLNPLFEGLAEPRDPLDPQLAGTLRGA